MDESPSREAQSAVDDQVIAAQGTAVVQIEEGESSPSENVYEKDESLHMYLGLHFPSSGAEEGVLPIIHHSHAPRHALRFPQRVAELLISLNSGRMERALDVGCAVGGSSFELAKRFDHVDAFDYSSNFVAAAKRMQAGEKVRFNVPIEADLFAEVTAVHEKGITQEICNKVNFFQGDACRLIEMMDKDEALGNYDGIIMSNLLCRLPDPLSCLGGLSSVVNKGGVVVIVTPFSWLEQFTLRSNWLGGFYDAASKESIFSKDELQRIMEEQGFEKIHEEEMPLVIREHQRKYQYIVSQATGWRKVRY